LKEVSQVLPRDEMQLRALVRIRDDYHQAQIQQTVDQWIRQGRKKIE
jgi:hypothetical protein